MLLRSFKNIFTKHPETSLVLVGNGEKEEALKDLVKTLDLSDSVYFPEGVEYSELTNYLAASDIFVFPSNQESLGKVLIEAGMAGIPAVSTATVGAQEILVQDKTGMLVPVGDEEKFTNTIIRLLSDEKIRCDMGAQAKHFLKDKFDREKNINTLMTFWQKTAKK